MDAQQSLRRLFAEHYEPIKATLSEPARYPAWLVESAILLALTDAVRSIQAGGAPDRQSLLASAVRQAVKLRRLAR
jgi:hypothetical protein